MTFCTKKQTVTILNLLPNKLSLVKNDYPEYYSTKRGLKMKAAIIITFIAILGILGYFIMHIIWSIININIKFYIPFDVNNFSFAENNLRCFCGLILKAI